MEVSTRGSSDGSTARRKTQAISSYGGMAEKEAMGSAAPTFVCPSPLLCLASFPLTHLKLKSGASEIKQRRSSREGATLGGSCGRLSEQQQGSSQPVCRPRPAGGGLEPAVQRAQSSAGRQAARSCRRRPPRLQVRRARPGHRGCLPPNPSPSALLSFQLLSKKY